jgi:hypothetical protein
MPSVAVNPPKTPVTKGSHGLATATLPNVCKMPGPPAPFVPTPLPNIGQSGKQPDGYSTTVTVERQPVAIRGASFGSMGDIASKGTGGGIVSNNAEGATKFLAPGSLNVQIEGKNVQYLGDQMLNNCGPGGSPANAATMGGVLQVTVGIPPDIQAAAELCEEQVEKEVANGRLTTTNKKPNCAVRGTWKHKCCKDLLEKQYDNVLCEDSCGSSNCRLDVAVVSLPKTSPPDVTHIFDYKFSCSGKAPTVSATQRNKYKVQFPKAQATVPVGP